MNLRVLFKPAGLSRVLISANWDYAVHGSRAMLLALVLIFLFTPNVAAAESAGDADAGWGIWETIGRFFNLFVLFGTVIYFARKPMIAFFEKRRQEIQQKLTEAERRRQEAESKIREIEQRMDRIQDQLAEIRARSEQDILEENRRVEESARQESDKILAVARREIEAMLKSAQKELRQHVGKLSVDLAGNMIRKNIDHNDQERIFKKFVSEMEEMK